jgi:hypothetical protein
MNPLSSLRQLVYVMDALWEVERLLLEWQIEAKDELAESSKAELALLKLRLQLRRSLDEGFGVFGNQEGVVIDEF